MPWKLYGDERGLNAPPRITRAPASCHLRRDGIDLLAAFHAARPGHHHHLLAADRDPAYLHHRPARIEIPARQFVGRGDAVGFLDPIHHLEDFQVHIHFAAHAAQHGVNDARGTVHIVAFTDHAVDDRLNLGLAGPLLHYNQHL